MAASERDELNALIARVFEADFGMRASHAEVSDQVLAMLPDHVRDYFASAGVRNQISSYSKKKNAHGLPQAPVADSAGTHVQLELMDFDELHFFATGYVNSAGANMAQARKVGAFAKETFDRDLVINGVNLSRKAAA